MSRLENQDSGPATPEVEEVKRRGALVRSDERYSIYDCVLDGRTYSVTELKPHKETRGHSHADVEERYFFKSGKGKFIVGDRTHQVDCRRMKEDELAFRVPQGAFHKAINTSGEPLVFVATFLGRRDDTNAVYGTSPKRGAER